MERRIIGLLEPENYAHFGFPFLRAKNYGFGVGSESRLNLFRFVYDFLAHAVRANFANFLEKRFSE